MTTFAEKNIILKKYLAIFLRETNLESKRQLIHMYDPYLGQWSHLLWRYLNEPNQRYHPDC